MPARKWCPVVIVSIRELAERAKLSRRQIGERIGISPETVYELQRSYRIKSFIDGRSKGTREIRKWTPEALDAIWELVETGLTAKQIGEKIGWREKNVHNAIAWESRERGKRISESERIKKIVARRHAKDKPRGPKESFSPVAWKPEGDLLAAINNIVPRGLPPVIRADVCQDLALAIIAGEIRLSAVSAETIVEFTRAAYKLSPLASGRVSLDAPCFDDDSPSLLDRMTASGEMPW